LDVLFGDEEWRNIRSVSDSKARKRVFIEYVQKRLVIAGAKYVLVFEMRNAQGALDYLLFFATQSIDGVRVMKEAMWTVDKSGSFTFTDYTFAAGPMLISPTIDYGPLRTQLAQRFKSQTVDIRAVEEYVLTETSYLRFKSEGLKAMEGKQIVAIPPAGKKHRLGGYPPGTQLRFE